MRCAGLPGKTMTALAGAEIKLIAQYKATTTIRKALVLKDTVTSRNGSALISWPPRLR